MYNGVYIVCPIHQKVQVQFLAKAHTCIAGSIPNQDVYERQPIYVSHIEFLSLSL